ncbi:MAG: hypothetical protein A2075_18505 [Geobacteraceae bacterium GWC2_58_44]|nr:MAG: hypothetical protein A2075_18505 [Geobacteraceae bacterium GWC2_58_44]HBG03994.1 hypothetical protein [Geobacter sp.]
MALTRDLVNQEPDGIMTRISSTLRIAPTDLLRPDAPRPQRPVPEEERIEIALTFDDVLVAAVM